MTRRTARHEPGLDALRAAVSELRGAEPARSARAGRVAFDPTEPGRPPVGRVTGRSGRLRAGSVPDPRTDAGPGTGATADGAPLPDSSFALVERAQAGDGEAFAELYDRYVLMVYRYVSYRVGGREVAEDLTSETFLRALRRIDTFTWQGRDVGAWFVTIARNLVADHYKSSRYRLELTVQDVAESAPVPLVEGPEAAVLAGLDNVALLDAVRRLSPEQQECVALRFLQDLSVAETAAVMGKNDSAVKALQHRAVRSLSRLLQGEGR